MINKSNTLRKEASICFLFLKVACVLQNKMEGAGSPIAVASKEQCVLHWTNSSGI